MSARRRALGRIARASLGAGALRLAPQLRADSRTVFSDAGQSVVAAAAEGLGTEVTSCAITLGPQRYNRKPVVQLMSPQGTTVGFLKVGADATTSAMVATEAAAVERLQPTTSVLEVPRVLWQSVWKQRSVACFSPVGIEGGSLVPADRSRLLDVATAVIEAGGGRRDVELRECAPVERLRAVATNDHRLAQGLVEKLDTLFDDATVTLAPWHGDFSPWNMISTARSTALIDWEFASLDMPVGADMLHHRLMVATHLEGASVEDPLEELLNLGENIPELHAMQIPSEQHRTHLLLYLLELIRRDIELASAGRITTGFGEAAGYAAQVILVQASAR